MQRRVLFVTEKFPWPIDDGGQIRTFQILRRLAARYPVTVVSLDPPSPNDLRPIRDLGVEVRTFRRRQPRWALPLFAATSLFDARPFPFNKSWSQAVFREVRQRLKAGQVAALHLNHLDGAQYFDALRTWIGDVPAVVDTHNVMATVYARYVETAPNVALKAFLWTQWAKMRAYEPRLLKRMSACIVCSDLEREVLSRWGVSSPVVVPNGVDTSRFEVRAGERPPGPPRLVFTGALDYRPNHDGMEWFLREVLPPLRARLPDFRLTVVGRNPAPSLHALADDHVELTGRVDDVRPYVRDADVFVAPLRVGGGTRLKILEAMALGVPVVSTTVGAEGIDARDGEHLLLADRPEAFADAVAALARDAERRAALSARGRALVVERYDWQAVTEPLVETYDRLLRRQSN
jgi:sugar transferase (PEP-CTERM/EpsH1 system associated)